MAKTTVTGREWLEFEDWACEELNLFDYRLKFMTDAERAESLGPREASGPLMIVKDGKLERLDGATREPEPSDEQWKQMLNDITAEDTRDKAELLALAERLGCSIYLAAYLRHLNRKLEIVADVFAGIKPAQDIPRKIRRRK